MVTLVNARIFDGQRMLSGHNNIKIDGKRIVSVGDTVVDQREEIIDVHGMTLMPGLITCHMHADYYRYSMAQAQAGLAFGKELPPGVLMAIAVRTCGVLLQSGFTGFVGAACAHDIDTQLQMAIADNIMDGPRILACGHFLGTTGDLVHNPNWWRDHTTPGAELIADGPIALRALVRDEVRRGVEIIKIFASDGHGQITRTKRNFARDELKAIVEAAHDRGAKVRAHAPKKDMVLECIEFGVDVIDHGDEIDEECIEAMVKAGTFWVPSLTHLKTWLELGWKDPTGEIARGYAQVRRMLPIADRAGVRILLGDDYSGFTRDLVEDDPLDHEVGRYGRELAMYAEIDGITPEMVMRWGTRNAGELLAHAPDKVGVIEAGALADLIIVEGDPLADISLFSRPEQALKAVICDGKAIINRLPDQVIQAAA